MKSKDPGVLIEQERTKQMTIQSVKDGLITIANNPLMQLAIFCAFIELMQMIRPDGKHQVISDNIGSTLEATAISAGVIDTLSNTVDKALGPVTKLMALVAK